MCMYSIHDTCAKNMHGDILLPNPNLSRGSRFMYECTKIGNLKDFLFVSANVTTIPIVRWPLEILSNSR